MLEAMVETLRLMAVWKNEALIRGGWDGFNRRFMLRHWEQYHYSKGA